MLTGVRAPGRLSWWSVAHQGGGAPDPVVFAKRASAVGAGIRISGGAEILLVRGESGPPDVFLGARRGKSALMLAGSLGAAVAAKTAVLDEAPVLDVDVPIWRLRADPSEFNGRDTQAGSSPVEVAEYVMRAMPPESWLVFSMRAPSRAVFWDELAVARGWWTHRLGGAATHYSRSTESVLSRMVAGGRNSDDVGDFLKSIGSVLPGFDVEVRAWRAWGRSWLVGIGVLLAVLLPAAVWGLSFATLEPLLPVAKWLSGDGALFAPAAAAVPGVLLALLGGLGVIPSAAEAIRRQLRAGVQLTVLSFPPILVRKPSKGGKDSESVNTFTLTAGKAAGGYPLFRRTFLLGPEQVAALACPHYGSAAGAATTRMRDVPAPMREMVGPVVGFAEDGQPVRIDAGAIWQSVFLAGIAGSGKSLAVANLFAFDSACRVNPQTDKPTWPGRRNTLIAFESKGAEGVRSYLDWVATTGDSVLLIDMADPGTAAIDMIGTAGSPEERANHFVSQMVYAFGESAIAHRSQNTLRQVFTLALQLTPADADQVKLASDTSFMDFADVLLTNMGDQLGLLLFKAAMDRCTKMKAGDAGRDELAAALSRIEPLYGASVTPSARRGLCEAPMSKVAILRSVPSWWSPSRARVDFTTILEEHWAVIINTGTPMSGGVLADEAVTKHVSAMLMHSLRRAIQQTCDAWRDRGRSVTIFADELSLLAGTSGDVFAWLRNQGRSFGVRQVLATQYPEQLSDQVQPVVLGSGTTIWFRQTAPKIIDPVVADLTKDGSSWTSADLVSLEPFYAIVKATVNDRAMPAVPVKMGFWGDDRSKFLTDQGFTIGGGW